MRSRSSSSDERDDALRAAAGDPAAGKSSGPPLSPPRFAGAAKSVLARVTTRSLSPKAAAAGAAPSPTTAESLGLPALPARSQAFAGA